MNFTPKKDEELNFELFPNGTYDFNVIKAFDKKSSAGNSMVELELEIYAHLSGRKTRVYDYLLEAIAYKIKHFCQSVGLDAEYEAGYIDAEMCKHKSGKCIIGIQRDKGGNYPDKNIVKDYCKNEKEIRNDDDINVEKIPF